jgi:hypothetical protein
MPGGRIPHRSLTPFRANVRSTHPQRSEIMLDVAFILLGLGLIGVMALYAQALTRA